MNSQGPEDLVTFTARRLSLFTAPRCLLHHLHPLLHTIIILGFVRALYTYLATQHLSALLDRDIVSGSTTRLKTFRHHQQIELYCRCRYSDREQLPYA